MKKNALSTADKRRLIAQAERYHGLPAGAGSAAAEGRRSYPADLVPPTKQGSGSSGDDSGGGGAERTHSMREAVETCWSLQRCLVILADAHASLNLRLTRGPEQDLVTAGAAYDLLQNVNPHWDPAMLWGMTSMAMDTSTEGCFWILDALDGQGRPTEIWWAAPGTVVPVRGDRKKDKPDDWYVSHYLVKTEGARGKGQRYDRERVVHIHAPNPFDEFAMLSPVASALTSAGLSLAAMHANQMIFDTGLTGAGYVAPPDGVTWTDEEKAKVARMFAMTVKGKAGWHRIMVSNRADFQVRALEGLSPRELQFIQMLGLTQNQVCIGMGVPEPLLSPTDTTFANAREARRTLWENTVIPRDKRISSAIKSQLLTPHFASEADDCFFDHSEVPELQGDAAARWALDKDQMEAMVQLARDVRDGTLTREGALQAAAYYIGAPETMAFAMLPEYEEITSGPLMLPPLGELLPFLSGVVAGSLPRASAVAVLEVRMGDRAVAEAIVADAGTAVRATPLPTLQFARDLVKDVARGELPRSSAEALLAEALGAPATATAVLADAQPPALPAPEAEVVDADADATADTTAAAPTPTPAVSAPATPATPATPSTMSAEGGQLPRGLVTPGREVFVYRGGQGYRLRDGADPKPLGTARLMTTADFLHTVSRPGQLVEAVDDVNDWRVYGSRAHRTAWEDEMAKLERRRQRIRTVAAKILADHVRDARAGLAGVTDEQLRAIAESTVADLDDPSTEDLDALAASLAREVLGRAAIPRWIDRGAAAMEAGLKDVANDVASDTLSGLGVDADPDMGADSAIGRALRQRAQLFATSTANTSWNSVGRELTRGLRSGESLDDMVARLSALDDRWQGSRAENIALTETHSASSTVARETARESGVVAGREWMSSLDDRVRESHQQAHGQRVGLDEPYTVGGRDCEGPGECGEPEEDCGCRCFEIWILEDSDG